MLITVRRETGFSLVELITVLALIGVLSAVAFARFSGVSSYTESLYQQQLLSYLRLAQRTAVAHQGAGAQLEVLRQSAENWQITLRFDGQTQTYPLQGEVTVSFVTGALSGTLSNGTTLSLQYSDNGDLTALSAPVAGIVTASLQLNVTGGRALCVSPSGFAYEGSCL